MRAYLSSYGLGNHADRFRALVGDAARGFVVMNALDGMDEERRRADTAVQIDALADVGWQADDLDLREVVGDALRRRLEQADFLWVRGGNVFSLRMAMVRSGLDALVVDGLAHDRFVYAGYSAGPCVLAPSLRGLEYCDPTEVCERAYGEVRFDGLGVLDRPFVPHLDSPGHPETELLGAVAKNYAAAGQVFWGLRDGQALVIEGNRAQIVG